MKFNLVFVLLLGATVTFAQVTDSILGPRDIEKLKTEYLEICKSREYVAQRKASINFYRKLPASKDLKYFTDSEVDFRVFVEKTLNSTKFTSVDEALTMRSTVLAAKAEFLERYGYFFRKIAKVPREQLKEILAPEFTTEDVLN